MPDLWEGVAADGTILTGANRARVPLAFEPVLADAVAFAGERGASLYVYGSVANGTVRAGSSDVDLLSVDLPEASDVGRLLSARYAGLCRGVEIAAATTADLAGDTDAAYGGRVFLRHYCVHLAGPDPAAALPGFPADIRAARGFNGDIAWHRRQWRRALESGKAAPDLLGARAARKTLLPDWSASTTAPGRPTVPVPRGAGGNSNPASPPGWASCSPGPRQIAAPHPTRSGGCSRTMGSSSPSLTASPG